MSLQYQRYLRYFLPLCCLGFLIVGCTSQTVEPITNQVVAQATAIQTHIPTVESSATSTKIAASKTPTATALPTATFTATATPVPSPTATQIATPRPTIPPDEVRAFALQLLEPDASCRYPCFWSFVPGQSRFEEVESFLLTFAQDIYYSEGLSGLKIISVTAPLPEASVRPGFAAFIDPVFLFEERVLVKADISLGESPHNSPTQILQEYGKPDEIWINTIGHKRETPPFRMTFLYLEQGFGLLYGIDAKLEDKTITACFDNSMPVGTNLAVWKPGISERIFREPPLVSFEQTKTLEDATGLTIDDFYTLFTDATASLCLQTDATLWN